MKRILICLIAVLFAAPAFADKLKNDAIACKQKNELDILTVLAAMGDMEGLNKTEKEYLDGNECVRLAKGTQVKITQSKRVLAGDPKIKGNSAHRRVGYHMATVTADGKPWVMHLQTIDTSDSGK